jgi:hypothetical protein
MRPDSLQLTATGSGLPPGSRLALTIAGEDLLYKGTRAIRNRTSIMPIALPLIAPLFASFIAVLTS